LNQPICKSSLSESEAQLIELLQSVSFGRIEYLQVRGGVPTMDPPPRVIRARKMGNLQGERPELSLRDFWLRQPFIDLIETIRKMGDGEILSITIQHGLPHLVETPYRVQQ
jgi:hypothetical protein